MFIFLSSTLCLNAFKVLVKIQINFLKQLVTSCSAHIKQILEPQLTNVSTEEKQAPLAVLAQSSLAPLAQLAFRFQ